LDGDTEPGDTERSLLLWRSMSSERRVDLRLWPGLVGAEPPGDGTADVFGLTPAETTAEEGAVAFGCCCASCSSSAADSADASLLASSVDGEINGGSLPSKMRDELSGEVSTRLIPLLCGFDEVIDGELLLLRCFPSLSLSPVGPAGEAGTGVLVLGDREPTAEVRFDARAARAAAALAAEVDASEEGGVGVWSIADAGTCADAAARFQGNTRLSTSCCSFPSEVEGVAVPAADALNKVDTSPASRRELTSATGTPAIKESVAPRLARRLAAMDRLGVANAEWFPLPLPLPLPWFEAPFGVLDPLADVLPEEEAPCPPCPCPTAKYTERRLACEVSVFRALPRCWCSGASEDSDKDEEAAAEGGRGCSTCGAEWDKEDVALLGHTSSSRTGSSEEASAAAVRARVSGENNESVRFSCLGLVLGDEAADAPALPLCPLPL